MLRQACVRHRLHTHSAQRRRFWGGSSALQKRATVSVGAGPHGHCRQSALCVHAATVRPKVTTGRALLAVGDRVALALGAARQPAHTRPRGRPTLQSSQLQNPRSLPALEAMGPQWRPPARGPFCFASSSSSSWSTILRGCSMSQDTNTPGALKQDDMATATSSASTPSRMSANSMTAGWKASFKS